MKNISSLVLIVVITVALMGVTSLYIVYSGHLHFQDKRASLPAPLWGTPKVSNKVIHDTALGIINHQEFESYAFRNYGKRKPGNKHLIFAGASNVAGLYLKNHQTLGAKIQKDVFFSDYETYLFGYNGWGPHNNFIFQKSDFFKSFIKQEKGFFIYMFIPDHIRRVCGTTSYLLWSYGLSPWLELKGNELQQVGYLNQKSKSLTLLFYAGLFYHSKKISSLLNDWSYLFSLKDEIMPIECFQKFATTVNAMKTEYLKKFPQGKFLIMRFYGVDIDGSPFELERIQSYLNKYQLKIKTFSEQRISNELKKQNLSRKTLVLKDGLHVSEKYHEFAIPFYKEALKQ